MLAMGFEFVAIYALILAVSPTIHGRCPSGAQGATKSVPDGFVSRREKELIDEMTSELLISSDDLKQDRQS